MYLYEEKLVAYPAPTLNASWLLLHCIHES